MKTLGLGLLLAAAAAGGYYLLSKGPAEAPAEPVQPAPGPGAQTTPPPVAPRSAEVKFRVDAAKVPAEDRLLLPDGSWAMALNGTKNPPPMDWPREIPFSPIVEMYTDQKGQQWYRHADGSHSTTEMTWRSDLGRMDAVTRVANPTTVLPREGDGPQLPPDPNRRN